MKKPSNTAKGGKTAGSKEPAKQPAAAATRGQTQGSKATKENFQKKLMICQKNYDYKDDSKNVKEKTERLNAINEIQQLLQDQKTVVSIIIPNLDDVMTMIEKNIFRPLPNVKKSNL